MRNITQPCRISRFRIQTKRQRICKLRHNFPNNGSHYNLLSLYPLRSKFVRRNITSSIYFKVATLLNQEIPCCGILWFLNCPTSTYAHLKIWYFRAAPTQVIFSIPYILSDSWSFNEKTPQNETYNLKFSSETPSSFDFINPKKYFKNTICPLSNRSNAIMTSLLVSIWI